MNTLGKRTLAFFAALVVGALLGNVQMSGLNGHGPEAGFAGLFLFLLFYPGLALVSAIVAMLAAGWRHSIYLVGAAGFFIGMVAGGFIG